LQASTAAVPGGAGAADISSSSNVRVPGQLGDSAYSYSDSDSEAQTDASLVKDEQWHTQKGILSRTPELMAVNPESIPSRAKVETITQSLSA